MSTKIFNGRRILASSLDDAVKKIFSLKPSFEQSLNKQLYSNALTRALKSVLQQTVASNLSLAGVEMKLEEPISNTDKPLNKILIDEFMKHKPRQECVILYPKAVTIEKKRYYLLTTHCTDSILQELNPPWYSEYAYWNNTDKPDTLTSRQWNKRARDWDTRVPSSYSLSGLNISFVSEDHNCDMIEVQDRSKIMQDYLNSIKHNKNNFSSRLRHNFFTDLLVQCLLSQPSEQQADKNIAAQNYWIIRDKIKNNRLSPQEQKISDLISLMVNCVFDNPIEPSLFDTHLKETIDKYTSLIQEKIVTQEKSNLDTSLVLSTQITAPTKKTKARKI